MQVKILCTLGPASLNKRAIVRLSDLGISMFRINLSHTEVKNLQEMITYIQGITDVPLCLDTEGAQIRNGQIKAGGVEIREHSIVSITRAPVVGDEKRFSLYPHHVVEKLKIGDFISVDFNSVMLQVVDTSSDDLKLRALSGGRMGQNKAVTVNRPIELSPLTEKDKTAIKICCEMGISNFALSFANYPGDVDLIRTLTGREATIISKIECRNGVKNLEGIAGKSDAILIDRGDLSREFPIERIPALQKHIIDQCVSQGVEVYVATNLLESMVKAPYPTRAEVNDVYMTLSSGANGLVLAAETAIGESPVACASMIVKLVHSFRIDQEKNEWERRFDDPKSLLIDPHGGHLCCCIASEEEIIAAVGFPKIQISKVDLMDCEQIAYGTYSPLEGFMDQEALYSVLESNRLPNGVVWTMPLILQIASKETSLITLGDRVALTNDQGASFAILDVTDIYKINMEVVAEKWYGTTSRKHAGVAQFMARGENCVAGKITLLQPLPSLYRHYQMTPDQCRLLFDHKGWSKVVGFHTRNPAHRAHEYIQIAALEESHADGLFISPVIGPNKVGDFLPKWSLRSYQSLLQKGVYPTGKVVLGSFSTYPRYCGPREAVFTMLCRKNMGCSHFIIGRDHAGVGAFYGREENLGLIENLGDLGIKPIFFDEIGYSPASGEFIRVDSGKEVLSISGSKVRETIKNGGTVPDWFMRNSVQDIFRQAVNRGVEVFQK